MRASFLPVPRSALLLLTAALVALAVFVVHDSRPASADHDTSVKELWSATLTVADLGGGLLGCSNFDSDTSKRCNQAARLTNDEFSFLNQPFAAQRIVVQSGGLRFQVSATPSAKFRSDLSLSIDGMSFPLADASVATLSVMGDASDWANTGLSWSAGDTVQVKITRPTFTGVELFGGDLVTSNAASAPTLTVAEGGSATFQVKLVQQPTPNTANVTVSVGLGQSRCAGCGGNQHDDINAGTVSPKTMTFTASNWNSGQTVTVTGVADDDSVHEHFLALVWVSSSTSTTTGDPFGAPEGALGAYVTVTDGSDDGSLHGAFTSYQQPQQQQQQPSYSPQIAKETGIQPPPAAPPPAAPPPAAPGYRPQAVSSQPDPGAGTDSGPPDIVDAYDANNNGKIDLGELLAAMRDYQNEQITRQQLQTIVRYYLTN